MSLSTEALAQLEGLDLQEARDGLSFSAAAEGGQSAGEDLSSEELAGLRSWDLSGVMARLNSLTFAPPPASMPEPETGAVLPPDGGVRVPTSEDDLPDWLKPAEAVAPPAGAGPPVEETVEPAPLPEEQPAAPGGPTAEEAAAGLAAAAAAGSGTQMVSGEEVVIPPAVAETPAAVEAGAKKGLAKWLEKIDFRKLARESSKYLIPSLTGLALGRLLPPEQAWNLTQTAFAVGMLGFIGSGGCAVAERVVSGHPRVAGIARLLAAGRVVGAVFAETGMLMAAGSFAGGLWHEGEIVRQAAAQMGQPEVTSGGGGNIGGDYYHGVSDVNLPQPPVEQAGPPKLSEEAADFLNQAGNTELTEAQERLAAEQAAMDAAQQAEAARQAALQLGPTVAELAAQMPKQTVSEAIYQMIGDVPHRGEVTNVLFRAIGDKVNNLNEGAIKAAADALRPVFDNIDKAVASSGVPYTEGGRAAVDALKGFNSPEAQAIRAANMGDLEAAGNLLNNVIGPVIK